MSAERGRRIAVFGTVISDKMEKTITVQEDRLVKHGTYGKYIRRGTSYKAHDERNEAREGDQVEIAYDRPRSKTKRWRLVRIVRRAAAGEEVSS
jgi:small subunit ribosomal protein S17